MEMGKNISVGRWNAKGEINNEKKKTKLQTRFPEWKCMLRAEFWRLKNWKNHEKNVPKFWATSIVFCLVNVEWMAN